MPWYNRVDENQTTPWRTYAMSIVLSEADNNQDISNSILRFIDFKIDPLLKKCSQKKKRFIIACKRSLKFYNIIPEKLAAICRANST